MPLCSFSALSSPLRNKANISFREILSEKPKHQNELGMLYFCFIVKTNVSLENCVHLCPPVRIVTSEQN